ncbi:MAG: Acetate kinase [Patescibacteria group bacterium]|nr:Acetate kinase [Patescibacteria group bacterium]
MKKKDKIILVSNIGSASRKYSVYSLVEKEGPKELFCIQFDQKEFYPSVRLEDAMIEFFEIAKNRYFLNIEDIDIVAERVVAVGEFFLENKIINEKYLEELDKAKKYDVLHTESLIHELRQLFSIKENSITKGVNCKFKIVGISDSAYHHSIPEETYTYAIKDFKPEHNFRKYGYHGISMSGVADELSKKYKKIIAIHLGGGGSVTAIKDGKSIFNSFGMTPVSGLINLTRVGDVDPFVILHIYKKNKKYFSLLDGGDTAFDLTKEEIYEKSGLFALTGEKDMRDVLDNLKVKNQKQKEKSEFALQVYINKINEYVGVAYAHLGGTDALVLTGSIFEKSQIFRKMFLPKVSWLNLQKRKIVIMKTEEEKEIVRLVIEGKFI